MELTGTNRPCGLTIFPLLPSETFKAFSLLPDLLLVAQASSLCRIVGANLVSALGEHEVRPYKLMVGRASVPAGFKGFTGN